MEWEVCCFLNALSARHALILPQVMLDENDWLRLKRQELQDPKIILTSTETGKNRSSAYDMNYKWMICDGDSSAYNEIWKTYESCESCENFMFPDNTEIEKVKMTAAYKDWVETHNNDTTDCDRVLKLDCIGHVQKRLGNHLIAWKQRNGVKPWSKSRAASATSNKVTENKMDANNVKSGKELTNGKDRNKEKAEKCTGCTRSHTLTMDAVKKLQLHYGKALRRHCISYSSSEEEKEKALEKMKRAV